MRINVLRIIFQHFLSLWDDERKIFSVSEIFIFIFVPVFIGVIFWIFSLNLEKDVYSLSVSVFSIFSALLLSVQIGLFSLFQRKWDAPTDEKKKSAFSERVKLRKNLLRELNINISYLNIFSCMTIVIVVVFYSFRFDEVFESVIYSILFSHFILTLLMVIKRAHALFQAEYEAD